MKIRWIKRDGIIFVALLTIVFAQANAEVPIGGSALAPKSVSLIPIEDAYLQGGNLLNDTFLRVAANNRISYLKFDLRGLPETVDSATLSMEVVGDPGSGTINFYAGTHSHWKESDQASASAPSKGALLDSISGNFNSNTVYSVDLVGYLNAQGDGVFTIIVEMVTGGDDVSFSSKEGSAAPSLEVSYMGYPPSKSIVDFTHQDGTHTIIRGVDIDSLNGDVWNFSDEDLLFEGAETVNDSNTKIYGGITTSWDNVVHNPNFVLRGFDDQLLLQVNPTVGDETTRSMEALLVWNKAHFLNHSSSDYVVFDAESSMSLVRVQGNGSTAARFVVNDGGTYYVSATTGGDTMVLNNPGADAWAPISTDTYAIGTFDYRTFSDIRGVGIYLSLTGAHQAIYGLGDFQVSATTTTNPPLGPPEAAIIDFTHLNGFHGSRTADYVFSNGSTWDFSDTTLLFNGPETSDDSNTKIYGGMQAFWPVGEESDHIFQLNPNDEGFKIQIKSDLETIGVRGFKALWVWDKAHFLNYSATTVAFNAESLFYTGSRMSLNVKTGGSSTTRFVVNDGGTYYVSNTGVSGAGSLTLSNLVAETWAPISPHDYRIGPYGTRTFTDIRGVGVYVTQSSGGISQAIYKLDDFQVFASRSNPASLPHKTTFTAYSESMTEDGWAFYWNAPTNWAVGNEGDLSSGAITDRSSWKPLLWSGSKWTPDGDDAANNSPSDYLRISASGGHTGGVGASDELDRYAISAFTIGQAGDYELLLGKVTTRELGNGVFVKIFLNGELHDELIVPNDETGEFSYIFNRLVPNDEIAVAVGANGNTGHDLYQLDYRIALLKPEYANPRRFYVADYGAVGDGVTDDGPAVRDAIAAWKKTVGPAALHFGTNQTYFLGDGPGGTAYFTLSGVTEKVVEGNGAELVFTPMNRGFNITECDHIVVRNFSVDYSPVGYSQGKIKSIDTSTGTLVFEPLSGYPAPTNPQGALSAVYNGDTLEYRFDTLMVDDTIDLSNGTFEIHVRSDQIGKLEEIKLNDLYVGKTYPNILGSDHWAVILENGTVAFDNVTLYSAPHFAFTSGSNTKPCLFRSIVMTPRHGSGRLISVYRDGLHCEGNRYGPVIENCYFTHMLDDCINLKAAGFEVSEIVSSHTIRLSQNKHQVGDVLQFVEDRSDVLGQAKVVAINGDETEVDVLPGGVNTSDTWVFNLSRANAGYVVQNNYFGLKRRLSGVIRCGEGKVLNNVSENNSGWWFGNEIHNGVHEGPIAQNILFQGNTVRNTSGGLRISTEQLSSDSPRPIQNIRIIDNHFEDRENISIRDAGNVLIQGNRFGATPFRYLRTTEGITLGHNTDADGNLLPDQTALLPSSYNQDVVVDEFDYSDWAEKAKLLGDAAVKTGDADADGMHNLLEYALGGDPLIGDASEVLPILQLTEDGAYYTYNERVGDPSLDYSVEHTADLSSEVWNGAGVEAIGESTIQNNFKAVTHKAEIDDAGFFRLNVD